MESYYDCMRRILQLADTGIEALEYFASGTNLPLYLLPDIADAFFAINKTYAVFLRKLPSNDIQEMSDIVANRLAAVGLALESSNINGVVYLVETALFPAFRNFRQELAKCFNPYILC